MTLSSTQTGLAIFVKLKLKFPFKNPVFTDVDGTRPLWRYTCTVARLMPAVDQNTPT